jgi:hypothetical protein
MDYPVLRYWSWSCLDVQDVANRLGRPFCFSKCEFDYENLYQWVEVEDLTGRRWNISRKHKDGATDFDDYLVIIISPLPDDIGATGQKLADTLNCNVSFGEGSYVKGDEWKFVEQLKFSPLVL